MEDISLEMDHFEDKYNFKSVFTQDKIIAAIKDGYIVRMGLNKDGELEARITNGTFIKETIAIKELNLLHDFTEHSIKNFRTSKIIKEVEAYEGIPIDGDKLNKLYCASNLATENAEINQMILRNVFFNVKINPTKMLLEFSDSFWYQAILMKLFGYRLVDILKANIIKLTIRYPSKTIKLSQKNEELEEAEVTKYLKSTHKKTL